MLESRIDNLIGRVKNDLRPVKSGKYIVAFAKHDRTLNEQLTLQCESVPLPGMTLTDTEHGIGAGTMKKIPTQKTFANEITLIFRISPSMVERNIFETWMNQIFDPNINIFNFYKNYIDDMSVRVQDDNDDIIYDCVFEGVYPNEVSPIELTASGEYLKQSVKFSYYKWRSRTHPTTPAKWATQYGDTNKSYDDPLTNNILTQGQPGDESGSMLRANKGKVERVETPDIATNTPTPKVERTVRSSYTINGRSVSEEEYRAFNKKHFSDFDSDFRDF
jgi:hypothetical protein